MKKFYIVLATAFMLLCTLSGCSINLNPPKSNGVTLTVVQSPILLEVGESTVIYADSSDGQEVVWESVNEDIATVTDGIVTGVSVGKTQIMAVTGTLSAVCDITVKEPAPQEIPDDTPIEKPSSDTLIITLAPVKTQVGKTVTVSAQSPTGGTIKWYSANNAVATVDNGVIKGVSVGITTITVSAGNSSAIFQVEVTAAQNDANNPQSHSGVTANGYKLTWRDEFDGNTLDSSKWGFQYGRQDHYGNSTGPWAWGNNELQYYTDRSENVGVKDGSLYITARRERMEDCEFTSSRILTRNKFSQAYGYFEARIKTPTGNGMWPAFWMLPEPSSSQSTQNVYGGWPVSGEIDIMEAKGRLYNKVDTTLHYASGNGGHRYSSGTTTLITNTDDWHTYAIDWTSEYITWYIDGKQVKTCSSTEWRNSSLSSASAPFDKPFHMLINFAVGGIYDGGIQPDESFTSATMYVDYVRVWQKV